MRVGVRYASSSDDRFEGRAIDQCERTSEGAHSQQVGSHIVKNGRAQRQSITDCANVVVTAVDRGCGCSCCDSDLELESASWWFRAGSRDGIGGVRIEASLANLE